MCDVPEGAASGMRRNCVLDRSNRCRTTLVLQNHGHKRQILGDRPQLASLVPREEYIHRAAYRAAKGLRLHSIDHAQEDALK